MLRVRVNVVGPDYLNLSEMECAGNPFCYAELPPSTFILTRLLRPSLCR